MVDQADAKRLDRLRVSHQAVDGGMVISLSTKSGPVPPEAIQLSQDDPKLIKLTIDGVNCKKAWQSWKSEGLRRALLYRSKKKRGRCYLKLRMLKKVSSDLVSPTRLIIAGDVTTFTFSWRASTKDAPSPKGSAKKSKPKASVDQPLPVEEKADEPTTQVAEEAVEQLLPEVDPGPTLELDAPQDHLLDGDRPHSIIETTVIGQIERARAYQSAPVILSLPMGYDVDESEKSDQVELMTKGTILLSALIDQEAQSRGGSIWLADQTLRSQIRRLNVNVPRLSLSQEKLVAEHAGASLVSRTHLRVITEGEGVGDLILSTVMTPADGASSHQDSDPGVYRVEHRLSKTLLQGAIDDAWVREYRSDSIWRAALLPGWGHLYRGERRRGWLFLSSGLGLAGGAILSGVLGYLAASDYRDSSPNTSHRRGDANAHYDRANLLWMGAAIVHITSLVDTLISAEDRTYFDLDRLDWDRARLKSERGGEQ